MYRQGESEQCERLRGKGINYDRAKRRSNIVKGGGVVL